MLETRKQPMVQRLANLCVKCISSDGENKNHFRAKNDKKLRSAPEKLNEKRNMSRIRNNTNSRK